MLQFISCILAFFVVLFIISEKARARGKKEVERCQCSIWRRAGAGGCRSLSNTRWGGARRREGGRMWRGGLTWAAFLGAVQVIAALPSAPSTKGGRNENNFDLSRSPSPVNSNIYGVCLPPSGTRRHICSTMDLLNISDSEFRTRNQSVAVLWPAKGGVTAIGNMCIPSALT